MVNITLPRKDGENKNMWNTDGVERPNDLKVSVANTALKHKAIPYAVLPRGGDTLLFRIPEYIYPPQGSKLREVWRQMREARGQTVNMNGFLHIRFNKSVIFPSFGQFLPAKPTLISGSTYKWNVPPDDIQVNKVGIVALSVSFKQRPAILEYKLTKEWWYGSSELYRWADRSGVFTVYYLDGKWLCLRKYRWHRWESEGGKESSQFQKIVNWSRPYFNASEMLSLDEDGELDEAYISEERRDTTHSGQIVDVPVPSEPQLRSLYFDQLNSGRKFQEEMLVDYSNPYRQSETPMWPYELSVGLEQAWSNATEQIPVTTNNMYQNLFGFRDMLAGTLSWFSKNNYRSTSQAWDDALRKVLSRKKVTSAGAPIDYIRQSTVLPRLSRSWDTPQFQAFKQAWFTGRYIWTPTMSDFENVKQMQDQYWASVLSPIYSDPMCHGKFTDDQGVTYRCSFQYKERVTDAIHQLARSAYKHGLQPNLTVVWDFIPYSFVVDWAVPVSDWLAANERAYNFGTQYYEFPKGFCFSVTYKIPFTLGGEAEVYCRWYRGIPPAFDMGRFMVEYQKKQPKSKTKIFRGLDAILLLSNF